MGLQESDILASLRPGDPAALLASALISSAPQPSQPTESVSSAHQPLPFFPAPASLLSCIPRRLGRLPDLRPLPARFMSPHTTTQPRPHQLLDSGCPGGAERPESWRTRSPTFQTSSASICPVTLSWYPLLYKPQFLPVTGQEWTL